MERLGIVDLGSNTARLVVYEYQPPGRFFRLIHEIREPVRLGEGMGLDMPRQDGSPGGHRLTPAAIERAAAALELYADFTASIALAPPRVIATSALRDASNAELFFDRIAPLDLEIDVHSGPEEAELGVLAVANSFAMDNAWVMDLGGGSAQISAMLERRCSSGQAYPLGAVRLTEAFLEHDPPRRSEIKALEARVTDDVATAMRRNDAPLVAMGGTIRNLCRAVQRSYSYPLGRVHGYFLSRKDLEGLVARLLEMPVAERRKTSGLHPDRADIILAGALVYRWLLRHGERKGLWISGAGVREGALFQHFLPAPHLLPDVRRFSIENFFERYRQPERHTRHVQFLARRLFDELAPLHRLGSAEAELLCYAARLHDVGMTVAYHNHHKHGAYLVETSPLLNGFTHREQALLRLLVRYHRKGRPRAGSFKAVLGRGDGKRLRCLASCLRLAEYLERSQTGRIEDIRVKIGRKKVRLELISREEPSVEIWEARKQIDLFKLAFGRKLVVRRGEGRERAAAK